VSFLIFKSITNHFSSNPKSLTLFDILLLINDFVPSQPIIHFPLYVTFLLEHEILVVRVVLFLNSFILNASFFRIYEKFTLFISKNKDIVILSFFNTSIKF